MSLPVPDLQSHRTQLVLTALGAAAVSASAVTAYNAYTRRRKRRSLDYDIQRSLELQTSFAGSHSLRRPSDAPLPSVSAKGKGKPGEGLREEEEEREEIELGGYAYDEELVREQLARNYAFFGEEGMKKVRGSSVVVVGCGGVGSWAAVMLCRSGVSKIRLIDFDYVTLSSLNRHATASLSDVGTPKVACVAQALKRMAKFVEVDARIELWRADESGAGLLEGADWVIDAIDNIGTKVDLLKYCVQQNIQIFSSMGAGAKADPTRIQIADISETLYDPLARSVRQRLRASGILSGIPVVYSTEVPGEVGLLPLKEEEFEKGKVGELAAIDEFRVRILPVLGPLPALFGLHAATYIICDLAGKPLERPLPVRHRKKLYEKLYKDLLHREQRISGRPINKLPLSTPDISTLFEDISLSRSILPPHATCSKPALVRWDPAAPLSLENVVLMEDRDVERHLGEVFGVLPGDKVSFEAEAEADVDTSEYGSGSGSGEERSWEDVSLQATGQRSAGAIVMVDALGERLRNSKKRVGRTPGEVWGAEVVGVVEKRRKEAERWRAWAL